MKNGTISLPLRYYQNSRIYGPGMPAAGKEGLHEETINRPVSQTGLVLVHCWNVGEENGPYPMDLKDRHPGEACDWVPAARGIMHQRIKPVLETARKAGMKIFHLGQTEYASRYESYRKLLDDPELQDPTKTGPFEICIRPRSVKELWDHEFGPGFPGPAWVTHQKVFDIADPVKPVGDEVVFLTGWQLNGLCRRHDIDLLFYVGFMGNGCVLNQPGAIREMAGKFRYRCVLLRDCTIHYEDEKTMENNWMTYTAAREVEMSHGFSALSTDFINGLKE